ncbi:hypothetical protein BDV96DRAFT_603491 [Lophiotrema nucula]|uniref:SH3 domain-containing protein n=1 Tax=Lophiotrema nucula TaxID=690887 RepID=A0A6A5YV55_9PLEO|nr:hypothetical protein BDV96DRAFT_603491 [Lophiotrema nucula]
MAITPIDDERRRAVEMSAMLFASVATCRAAPRQRSPGESCQRFQHDQFQAGIVAVSAARVYGRTHGAETSSCLLSPAQSEPETSNRPLAASLLAARGLKIAACIQSTIATQHAPRPSASTAASRDSTSSTTSPQLSRDPPAAGCALLPPVESRRRSALPAAAPAPLDVHWSVAASGSLKRSRRGHWCRHCANIPPEQLSTVSLRPAIPTAPEPPPRYQRTVIWEQGAATAEPLRWRRALFELVQEGIPETAPVQLDVGTTTAHILRAISRTRLVSSWSRPTLGDLASPLLTLSGAFAQNIPRMTDHGTLAEKPTELRRLENITEGRVVRGRQRDADMAAHVLSPRSEPGSLTSPSATRTSLPPLVTSPPSKAKLERASSYANKRLSTFSIKSDAQSVRSRPTSTAFPIFHSSLPYSLVRDFAYGPLHPLFYGPLPEQPSDISTPASEVSRRLSDPPPVAWHTDRGGWSAGSWEPGEQLPQTAYGDGPPYSEDDDIHSPVVTSHTRHKKHKSNVVDFDQTRGRRSFPEEHRRGSYSGTNGDGSQIYYVSDLNEAANGPGGEYITYPPAQAQSSSVLSVPEDGSRRDSHFATTLPQRAYADGEAPLDDSDEEMSEPEDYLYDESRFSKDYQFTIASPEEEMHGKAVALFDFARENDNELPLVEGQVILVSYRHGQGWLVAQDPKTGESGLVPEEYVRLLRDIEGGWNGLMDGAANPNPETTSNGAGNGNGNSNGHESLLSPISAGPEAKTPTQADHRAYTPVISTFSTSTKDLEPYPTDKLGTPTNTEGGSFARPRDTSKDRTEGADKAEAGPMEGVESSPEPTERHSQESRS